MQLLITSSAVFFIFLLLALLLAVLQPHIQPDRSIPHSLKQDSDALEAFIKKVLVKNNSRYNWNNKQHPCDWPGLTCGPGNLSVVTLRLPAATLVGTIPPSTIGKLYSLRTLSIHTNGLSGPIPDDFANLTELRYVYLHNNSFSGPFPSSVAKWTKLLALDLSGNNFHGRLPNNVPSSIKPEYFNLSDNNFIGQIPQNLTHFPVAAFSGNIYLLGNGLPDGINNNTKIPLQSQRQPQPQPPSVSPSLDHNNNNKKLCIETIAVGSALILLILFSYLRKKLGQAVKEKKAPGEATMVADKARRESGGGGGGEEGTSSSKDDVTGAFVEDERNKLVSFDGGVYSFDLEDLLKASVEVAFLQEGTVVVVKRLKNVVVSEEEFDGVMEGLRKMKNENVVPIRAYYYSKDKKLLVRDYFPAGSLAALLHGSRGSGCTPLDWDHRFRIALSAAKGVAYLHVTGKMVHGNIKSSNILLRQDSNKDACVPDFGLNTLFGGSSSPNTHVTGYLAPEVLKTREVTFKSDVYSFGVLLLELLSGKAPNHASLREKRTDLPSWVKSVKEEWTVQEKWTTEVFDAQLMMYPNIEGEMVQLLRIAMACVSIVPDQRPAMQEVVWMMEDMNRAKTDDGMGQSSDDPSKGSDGHTPPMGSRNSPNTVTP